MVDNGGKRNGHTHAPSRRVKTRLLITQFQTLQPGAVMPDRLWMLWKALYLTPAFCTSRHRAKKQLQQSYLDHHRRRSITNTGAFLRNGDTPPVFTPSLTGISLPRCHHLRPCPGCNGQGRRERLTWLGRREARRGGGVDAAAAAPPQAASSGPQVTEQIPRKNGEAVGGQLLKPTPRAERAPIATTSTKNEFKNKEANTRPRCH